MESSKHIAKKPAKKPTSIEDGSWKKRKRDDGSATAESGNSTAITEAYSMVIEDLRRHGLSSVASLVVRENPHTKRDPVAVLGKDLCHRIFSFLCEKPETYKAGEHKYKTGFTKKEWLCGVAGNLYSQLRSVSPVWKATFDAIPWADWVGKVEVQLESVYSEQSQSMIRWLCRYKIQLGHVHIANGIRAMHVPVFTKLITECQTKGLCGLYFSTRGLHKTHETAEKNLHDTIAQQCPNITNMALSLWLPKNTPIYKDYVSKALFSISSITWLCIHIGFCDDIGPAAVDPKWGTKTPIEGRFFTKLIQNLPNLRTLHIQSLLESRLLHCKNQRFHVESKTLEHFNVVKFFKGAVISLDCPALKQFECVGGPDGNGCLPNNQFSQGRYQAMCARVGAYAHVFSSYPWMASPLLQVPNECIIYFYNFRNWSGSPNGYEELMQRSNVFATATYETFVEE